MLFDECLSAVANIAGDFDAIAGSLLHAPDQGVSMTYLELASSIIWRNSMFSPLL